MLRQSLLLVQVAMWFENKKRPRGTIVVEVLIAIGLTAVLVVSAVSLTVRVRRMIEQTSVEARGAMLAQEGLAALQGVSFDDLNSGTTGALEWSNPSWNVVPGTTEVIDDFTRIVSVEPVYRDGSCLVVTSGGTVDPDSLLLKSKTSWTTLSGADRSVTSTSHRTRWNNPQGSCFLPAQAGNISIDLTIAGWQGEKQLRDVYIENTGTQSVTIDKIRFEWNSSATINQVFLELDKVWSSGGPGTPLGVQNSIAELDIVDVNIDPGNRDQMHKVQFSQEMENVTLTITLIFTDGTELSSGPFTP